MFHFEIVVKNGVNLEFMEIVLDCLEHVLQLIGLEIHNSAVYEEKENK